MTYQNYSLKQLQQIDAAHHLHPFTDHKELRDIGSRMITRAEGPFIYDFEGAELLDGMAGLWCVNVGYGREELAEAAYAQMKELPYYNSFFKCSTPTPVLLSKKLAEIAPKNINQVFYGSSGSESNDTALRLVRHYWALEGKPEKNRIISRQMAYHGSTVAGTSLGGMDGMHDQLGGAVPNIVHVMMPYAYELALPGESDHDFGLRAAKAVEDAILEAGRGQCRGLHRRADHGGGRASRFRRPAIGRKIQRICRKYDVLLMLDEVITGYGRTGEWFAAQTFGIEPDTITTAKALTSGYQPLSALAGRRPHRRDAGREGRRVLPRLHLCRASGGLRGGAEEPRDHRDAKGWSSASRTIPVLISPRRCRSGSPGHPLVGEVRSIGLMGAIEIVKDKATRERFSPAGSAAVIVRDHAIANGMMLRATGDTMILSPPLIWTRETIDMAGDRILKALDLAEADLRKA